MIWSIKAKDDYGYGYAAGRSRERLLRAVLKLAMATYKKSGADPAAVAIESRRHLEILKTSYPAYLERTTGLSRALGMDLNEVIAGGLAVSSVLRAGCTNFAAVPPATEGDRVFVSWNFDLMPAIKLLLGKMPLYIRDVQGSKPYVCLGFPPLFGIGIMNGDGLCSVVNSVGATDGGEGLTFFELNNLAMETQSTVDGVVGVWRDNPREVVPGLAAAIIMNSNNIFADMKGEAVLIEHSHNHMNVVRAADHNGVLASANHHQFLDRKLSGGADPNIEPLITGSFARLARMWELLETFYGRIDPRIAKIIASDHGLNYESLKEFGIERGEYEERIDDATICCHPWNFFHHLGRFELEEALIEWATANTLNSMLMDPKRCTIWLTKGRPCRKQYIPIWLGDALRMDWADRARQEIDYTPGLVPKSHQKRKDAMRRPNPTPTSERVRAIGISLFSTLERLIAASVVQGEEAKGVAQQSETRERERVL